MANQGSQGPCYVFFNNNTTLYGLRIPVVASLDEYIVKIPISSPPPFNHFQNFRLHISETVDTDPADTGFLLYVQPERNRCLPNCLQYFCSNVINAEMEAERKHFLFIDILIGILLALA